jgi:hypothetical protein
MLVVSVMLNKQNGCSEVTEFLVPAYLQNENYIQ